MPKWSWRFLVAGQKRSRIPLLVIGTHLLLYSRMFYSRDPEADRAFFRDVFGFSHVNAGGGWLIFALPVPRAR